jgi:hypothetical protein
LKKQKLIFLLINLLCLVGCIVSLFYPYLLKLNFSPHHHLPGVIYGYEYEFAKFSLVLNAIIVVRIIRENNILYTLIICAINLIFVYLIREFIHFQGFIDHDYDSKTGVGYLLLFYTSIVQFMVISGLSIIKKWRLLK